MEATHRLRQSAIRLMRGVRDPRQLIRNIGSNLRAAWFPQRCLLCLSLARGDFCLACQPLLDRADLLRHARCLRCGRIKTQREQPKGSHTCKHADSPWDRVWIGMDYQVPLDGVLMLGKYGGDPNACRALGRWLGQRRPFSCHADGQEPPLLIPIPSTPSKLRQRGYNPVEQIARGWVQQAKLDHRNAPRLESRVLLRHDNGTSQSRRTGKERALSAQAREASPPDPSHGTAGFYLGPGAQPALHTRRPIVLLDDVMTTGSTLAAACLALKAKPIQSISLVVLMRR